MMNDSHPNGYDLIIIGGSTAGLATGIFARLAGLTVLIFEPRPMNSDKPCGEGIMPPALDDLKKMGVCIPAGFPIAGITYFQNQKIASGNFSTDGSSIGRGISRLLLRAAMLDRAAALGCHFKSERAENIDISELSVQVNAMTAKWLIGADGLRSKVSKLIPDNTKNRLFGERYGMRRHYAVAPWSNRVEVYWGAKCEYYITPVGPKLVNLAILGPMMTNFEAELSADCPELASRLQHPTEKFRGAGPFENRKRYVQSGRIFLVGDAAGFLDPITGEGNNLAISAARSCVEAIANGRPTDYNRTWKRITRRYFLLTSILLFLAQSPARGLITTVINIFPKGFTWILSLLLAPPKTASKRAVSNANQCHK